MVFGFKTKFLSFFLILGLFFSVSSGADLLSCEIRNTDCFADESRVFALTSDSTYTDSTGKVISSPVSTTFGEVGYDKALCCQIDTRSNLGQLDFNYVDANNECGGVYEELMYLTADVNGRTCFKDYNVNDANPLFNLPFYSKKLCVKVPSAFSSMDIKITEDNSLGGVGYTCMYRTNDVNSGVVSDCNAEFSGNVNYKYTVWTRLWENEASLKCNQDCTSVLDNRVYEDCGAKIQECSAVVSSCNGALYDSWVKYNSSHEILCGGTWSETRVKKFSDERVFVQSDYETCENLIKKTFQVTLDNEIVTMNIYMCDD